MPCPLSGRKRVTSATAPNEMRYDDYLHLKQILDSQVPRSEIPDELLFIIQHQTAELWMKLMLYELTQAIQHLGSDNLPAALKAIARVQRIMDHLNHAWSVLATLTPSDFLAMRPSLGSASGHQSVQFREIEFLLGNKSSAHLADHTQDELALHALQKRLMAPSLYDEVVRLMAARGMDIDQSRLQFEHSEPTSHSPSVEAAWLQVYRQPEEHRELYTLGEQLVELEDSVKHWRFRHLCTVERIIGHRQGTGGTSGVSYLRSTLNTVLFPELWQLRTHL
ncbi:tryptophan 2,3-dioxygenase [Halomonas sp. AOP12-C2-37]|uniref:Tryptophan 2,3-dioxygenase n=1 Tax=Halomonas citrativorans TaxID=2742612 RepID=A0A1R4HY01_9GAMM|nr:tryptophan 2,3-dioxygenase family protein [Halomonas citrativorans]MBE0402389.1 tryptophan 2,3-dioxygenase [Halomonas citrativorans]SJN12419.1 Tryptophan 2,3-dioxygenase [Halomonas citrativorans]